MQVSRRAAAARKLIALKCGEEQRICLNNHFSDHVVKRPVTQNPPRDCTLHSSEGLPLVGPEPRAKRNFAFKSAMGGGALVAQEGEGEGPNHEKWPLPFVGLCPQAAVFSHRPVGSAAADLAGCPAVHPRGEPLLSGKAATRASSPDAESEGGEYCSLTDCCREAPVHPGRGSGTTKGVWLESDPSLANAAVNARPELRPANCSEGESRTLHSDSVFQWEKHSPDSMCNRSCSEIVASECPSNTALNSCRPFVMLPETSRCPLVGEPEQMKGKHLESPAIHAGQLLTPLVESPPNEPIYAESTKRKKMQFPPSSAQASSDVLAYGSVKNSAASLWKERTHHLGTEWDVQETPAQVAATITIVAAHPEDDNRTIFLSSPDSAVGVQWPWVSPTSHPEIGRAPSFFESQEWPQASGEMNSQESGLGLQSQTAGKNVTSESPAVPPKLSKGESPPRGGEGSLPRSGRQSPAVGNCESQAHEDADVPKQHTADSVVLGPPPLLNRLSPEEPNRGPPSLSGSERRHKYYNTAWSRQCRIEEEEEEEQGLWKRTQEEAADVGNGTSNPPSTTAECHQGGKCPIQENKVGGMSKSASFAFEFPKDKDGNGEFAPPPPPPPPKKQSRYAD